VSSVGGVTAQLSGSSISARRAMSSISRLSLDEGSIPRPPAAAFRIEARPGVFEEQVHVLGEPRRRAVAVRSERADQHPLDAELRKEVAESPKCGSHHRERSACPCAGARGVRRGRRHPRPRRPDEQGNHGSDGSVRDDRTSRRVMPAGDPRGAKRSGARCARSRRGLHERRDPFLHYSAEATRTPFGSYRTRYNNPPDTRTQRSRSIIRSATRDSSVVAAEP